MSQWICSMHDGTQHKAKMQVILACWDAQNSNELVPLEMTIQQTNPKKVNWIYLLEFFILKNKLFKQLEFIKNVRSDSNLAYHLKHLNFEALAHRWTCRALLISLAVTLCSYESAILMLFISLVGCNITTLNTKMRRDIKNKRICRASQRWD